MEWRTDYGAEAQVQPYGVLFCLGRRTEGVQGGTEGNISPVGCPPKAEMTRSSGKQQAERTAVRAAPIVCPEESPLQASMCVNLAGSSPQPGADAPTTARAVGLPPRRGKYFLSKRKKVPKKARGTATTEAAHVAMHCGQALRCAWAWLRASWLSAISGASRPSASLGRGLRSAGAERLDAPNLFGASNSGP